MVASPPLIEIREWGRPARRRLLSQPLTIGRDCPGEALADDGVSREHLRLVPSPTSLSAVDLGSRNGTTINGTALTGRAALAPGDVLRLGRSEIIVLHPPSVELNGDELEHDSTRIGLKATSVPPPPPPPPTKHSRFMTLAERILGIDPTGERDLFRAYNELPTKVPLRVWQSARVITMAAYLTVIALLFVRPAAGLFVIFQVIVPLLPILFFVAPGLWRNVCPMAASNQMPRVLGIGGTRAVPEWLRKRGYLIAVAGFLGIAGARLAGLDHNGAAMGAVLVAVIVAAVAGGLVFKGKSGWCSSICPLLPLQRVYGQTPFVTVPNSHCTTCVGCAKNCYDFKPRAAWHADMADPDKGWSGPRKLFVAALPGFIVGFFVLKGHAEYCDDTAVRIACARDAHQHRLVFRDRCHVTAQPVDADRGLRGGGAERVLLVCRPRACGRGYGGHRRRRWVAALADLGHGRGPHAAVDRPDPGQRAAVRTDHRGTDGTGPPRNA